MRAQQPATLVRVGGYALEVGPDAESFAHFEPEREEQNAHALAAALAEEPEESTLVESAEAVHETAGGVTLQVERADAMVRASLAGNPLEFGALSGEIDTMLALLGRLDRNGRFEEQLRLIRALHGLLMLAGRWLDLIRALRSTLRAAQSTGSEEGQAWVHRELGSLHLCAGNPTSAMTHLSEAIAHETALGAGHCATRHNYDCARRDEVARVTGPPRFPRRVLRLAGLVGALMLLAGAGTAIAFTVRGEKKDHHAGGSTSGGDTGPTSSSTPQSSSTGTTAPPDTTPPSVRLEVPADGDAISTATPEFSGAAGAERGDEPRVVVVVLNATGDAVPGSPFLAPVNGKAWAYTPTVSLADGSYTASVQQKDRAGNPGTSAVNAFTIDTRAPVLRLSCPRTITTNPHRCLLSSSEAGTAHLEVYERLIAPDGNVTEKLLPESPTATVQLKAPTQIDVDLPAMEERGFEFVLIAVQSDAAGNTGRSKPEEVSPVE